MNIKSLKPETPRVRKLMLFSLIVMLCFCFIVGLQALSSYRLAVDDAKEDATRVTRILTDHAELTFLSVDLSLRRAVERQYFNALFGGNLPEYMEHNFAMWVEELPQISAMMLINEEGYVEAASYEEGFENFVVAAKSIDGRDFVKLGTPIEKDSHFYFTAGFLRDDPEREIIIMTRKLNKLDGGYGGVVMAAVNPEYFVDFFDSIIQGEHHFMRMELADNTVMVEGPNEAERSGALRKAMQSMLADTESDAISTRQAYVAGDNKIFSSARLSSFPVSISIALDSQDFLAFWKSNQLKDVLFLTIFLLFGTALSLFAVTMERQIKRVQESEASAVLASQTKSEFLANMSHEFRTPLNAIIGFSEMLNSGYFGKLNTKQKERINDIHLCGNHLLQLISDILEFSKGEAGKLELREETVDLREIVSECERMMHEKIHLKDIRLVLEMDDEHAWIKGDKRKLRQVLLNLISNSVKFTPQGGTVTVTSFLQEDNRLNFSVTDTGIGMAEADIPKAMSVFGQVHRSQSLEGTGLGLPLCKIFAELHGGELHLFSELGKGTRVEIIFPKRRLLAKAVAESQTAMQDAPAPESDKSNPTPAGKDKPKPAGKKTRKKKS